MKQLKLLRVKKGLSQDELAQTLGLSQAAVSSWECGLSQPTSKQLPKLAEILGCTIDELFREEASV